MWIIHIGTRVFTFQLHIRLLIKKLNQTSAMKYKQKYFSREIWDPKF